MDYKYDPETDVLVITLSRGRPDFGEQRGNIIAHYNKNGKPVQLEILDARATVQRMKETVSLSKRPVPA